ncbi:HNH endonuclease [Microbacterium hominis]|uniref:HNH endonuclease n=1 Tax=Microbacterium hominis TaxID=162426 RepID=A0A7D4PZR6_9MICO|nr:HNH endonuclease [Microbacterium hominis]QKJ18572.1 HNH endonuclease [Microbacterium hominis]
MRSREEELAIRADIFRWLDEQFIGQGGYEIHSSVLRGYHFGDQHIPLLDRGKGIRNPATFSSTLSIMSGWKANKYSDYESDDGWVTYHYREGEGGDNTKLVRAWANGDPLVYFRAVREGFYIPYYPIVIAHNDPVARVVRFPLDQALTFLGDPGSYDEQKRRYAESIVRTRLHQPIFRARVLHAYSGACTVCDIRHSELLDAAHIIPDAEEHGVAHVTNGLAMCKIHHAAYDRSLMGITADFEVRIDQELLDEIDGPMLRHGLQDMHGRPIRLPSSRAAHPDRDRLAQKFELFARR